MRRLTLVLLLLLVSVPARGNEKGVLTLFLNGDKRGDEFVYVIGSADVLISRESYDALGLAPAVPDIPIDGRLYVSLAAAGPLVAFTIDDRELKLLLTAPPEAFSSTIVDLARKRPDGVLRPACDSFFLNYGVSAGRAEADGVPAEDWWSLPHEAALRVGDYLFDGVAAWRALPGESPDYIRFSTTLTRDFTDPLLRLEVGDVTGSAGELAGGALLGGMGLARRFDLDPYALRVEGFSLSGQVARSSELEVWRDGFLVTRKRVPPGPFRLDNLPLSEGAGEVTLMVRDSLGGEERVAVPYSYWPSLLAPGVQDFSYAVGAVRRKVDDEDGDYGGGPAFLFHHEFGIVAGANLGVQGGIARGVGTFGGNTRLSLGRWGLLSLAGVASQASFFGDEELRGGAFRANWSDRADHLGLGYGVTWQGWTRNFSAIGDERRPRTLRSSTALNANLALGGRGGQGGNLALLFSKAEPFEEGADRRLSLRFTRPLPGNLNLELSASKSWDGERAWEALAQLHYRFAEQGRGTIIGGRDGGGGRAGAVVGWAGRSETDANGEFRWERQEGETSRYDLDVAGGLPFADIRGRASRYGGGRSSQMSFSGSVAGVGGYWHLGAPIRDSFAVVKVDGLAGVNVTGDGARSPTRGDGTVLLPGVRSTGENRARVEVNDLPLNYQLPKGELVYSAPWKSGVFLDFPIEKVQAVQGMIVVREGEKSVPARGWGIRLTRGGREEIVPVVDEGVFYIENLPAGTHRVVVFSGSRECTVDLVVPRSEKALIDLGTLTLTCPPSAPVSH